MHVHLDALGGLAGDMFLGALLHAWPEHFDGLVTAIRQAGLPETVSVNVAPHQDHTLSGNRFTVETARDAPAPAGRYREIRKRMLAADLAPPLRDRALDIFALLAQAEGVVHGVAAEDVIFHEVAGWDSVADIVGASYMLEVLQIGSWSVSALPVGGGRVNTAHGPLPVPAPATAILLEGFDMMDDGIMGERVTPTGAAILRHLRPTRSLPSGPLRLCAAGTGFGSRRLEGISNVVRLLAYEKGESAAARETVAVVSFEIDDQTAEDLAMGLEVLRARRGVLDAVQAPVFGKKGRMMTSVRLLCQPAVLDDIVDACFTETTTIGVRWRLDSRTTLVRHSAHGGKVKLVERPGGLTAKMEIDAVRDLAGGTVARTGRRRAAEARALKDSSDS